MQYIIVDLEATCWDEQVDRTKMEIIEIGAVVVEARHDEIIREFSRFVRPIVEPILSEFCKQLTTITQAQVDQAEPFPVVFREFVSWIGGEEFTLCSWGGYDLTQFRLDCGRHRIALPRTFERHVNVKQEFARVMNVRPCGMSKALKIASA